MPRIRCHYTDCAYVQSGYCNATSVELDPDEGCMTYVMDIEDDTEPETESTFIEEDDDDDDFDLYEDEDDDDSDFEWDDDDDDDDF